MAPHEVLELSHDPKPRPQWPARRGPSPYDFAKIGFALFGLPRNAFGSIDVTNRCNLRCTHCYYYAGDDSSLPPELSADEWVEHLEELKRSSGLKLPFFNATWVGGDPLVRRDVIERCKPFFKYNTIVTNGTMPLPDWPDVNWYVSVDGDERAHEAMRDPQGHYRKNGGRGIYHRVRENVRANQHLRITICCVITRENVSSIESVVRDWYEAGARNITFDFFTPIKGLANADLWLNPQERDDAIDKLLALREIYGDFFVIPERALRLMRSEHCMDVTTNCLLRDRSFSLNASGKTKGKCVMGNNADCDRCGCIAPFYLRSLTHRPMILEDLGRSALRSLRAAMTLASN
ncbi:MAG: radical SAM protein [Candidatus Binatia bacterium]|nr:radical SAM protein [Candidatus Binatia bacterium]